jgi:MFS family permease
LLAALLIDADPVLLLLSAAALFALITVAHQITMRPVTRRPAAPGNPSGGTEPARTSQCQALSGALRPVLFAAVAFYLYFFFQSFMGLYAAGVSNIQVLGWAMLVNCAMVVLLQPPLSGWIARADFRRLLAGSFALMATGMAVMSLGDTPALLVGTALFTLGEVFLFLRCDLELVDRVPGNPAFAFGVQRLTAGIGGLLAGVIGGFVFAHYQGQGDLGMFWIVVAIQCAVAAVAALLFGGRRAAAREKSGLDPELEAVS